VAVSGFTLPPEVTSEEQRLADGWAYVFRHRRLGMLGRLLLQDLPSGQSHLRCDVAGDPGDPMTAERGRIFRPTGLALSAQPVAALGSVAGVSVPPIPPALPPDPGQWVATRVMICPRCDAPTSAIYDVSSAAEPAQFEGPGPPALPRLCAARRAGLDHRRRGQRPSRLASTHHGDLTAARADRGHPAGAVQCTDRRDQRDALHITASRPAGRPRKARK
jgi:hypothetical protein